MWRARALEPLLGVLTGKTSDGCKEAAVKCVRNLVVGNAGVQAEACRRGFVPVLVSVMREAPTRMREYAIGAPGAGDRRPPSTRL